jgi:hypothetical protein
MQKKSHLPEIISTVRNNQAEKIKPKQAIKAENGKSTIGNTDYWS